jgi:hypothetical protein
MGRAWLEGVGRQYAEENNVVEGRGRGRKLEKIA